MHEVGIMESAVEAVLDQARRCDARRVHRIVLRIGSLSGVEPDALRFAFDIVTAGTIADGATLEIETVPARAHCPNCGIDFEAGAGWIFNCPQCSRLSGDLRQGREIELCRIEFSTESAADPNRGAAPVAGTRAQGGVQLSSPPPTQ